MVVAASGSNAAIHLWSRSSQHHSAALAAANAVDQTGLSERQKMARMIARIAAHSAAQTTRSMIADRSGDMDVAHNEAARATSQAAAGTR